MSLTATSWLVHLLLPNFAEGFSHIMTTTISLTSILKTVFGPLSYSNYINLCLWIHLEIRCLLSSLFCILLYKEFIIGRAKKKQNLFILVWDCIRNRIFSYPVNTRKLELRYVKGYFDSLCSVYFWQSSSVEL